MNRKYTTNYGNVSLTTLRTIFGDEMTYNELALLVDDWYDLKVEINTYTFRDNTNTFRGTQLVRVWFDDKVVMDKSYSTAHSCNMFYFLNEIEHTMEEDEDEDEDEDT
jgi:hypothetical protein